MAQLSGIRTTSQTITTEDRLVRFVKDDIVMLEPEITPLITFLMKMGGKYSPCTSPRIEWIEDDYCARWAVAGSTTVANNASSTTVPVTDGTLFQAGDIFIVPQAVNSSTAPEQIRVTTVSSNNLTVVRNVGSTGLVTIVPGADLAILGTAFEEGATPPTAKTTTPNTEISYTEIFRKTTNISKTTAASKHYGAPAGERARQWAKKIKEMKIDMNRQFLFGTKSEGLTSGPNGFPVRTTMGLNSVISTNVTDASTTLTEATLASFAQTSFRYGSKTKLLLAAPIVIRAVHSWARGKMDLVPADKSYGLQIQKVVMGHGTWLLVNDWMLENGAGGNGFGGWAFSIDLDHLKLHYLNGNDVGNRDWQVQKDLIKDGRDAYVDEVLCEVGLCVQNEKTHAKMFNVTAFT